MNASWSGAGWAVRSIRRVGDEVTFEARLTDAATTEPLRITLLEGRMRVGALLMEPSALAEPRGAWQHCGLPMDDLRPV